jgi:hypothetical protein
MQDVWKRPSQNVIVLHQHAVLIVHLSYVQYCGLTVPYGQIVPVTRMHMFGASYSVKILPSPTAGGAVAAQLPSEL